jgi:hypothetical protein
MAVKQMLQIAFAGSGYKATYPVIYPIGDLIPPTTCRVGFLLVGLFHRLSLPAYNQISSELYHQTALPASKKMPRNGAFFYL